MVLTQHPLMQPAWPWTHTQTWSSVSTYSEPFCYLPKLMCFPHLLTNMWCHHWHLSHRKVFLLQVDFNAQLEYLILHFGQQYSVHLVQAMALSTRRETIWRPIGSRFSYDASFLTWKTTLYHPMTSEGDECGRDGTTDNNVNNKKRRHSSDTMTTEWSSESSLSWLSICIISHIDKNIQEVLFSFVKLSIL